MDYCTLMYYKSGTHVGVRIINLSSDTMTYWIYPEVTPSKYTNALSKSIKESSSPSINTHKLTCPTYSPSCTYSCNYRRGDSHRISFCAHGIDRRRRRGGFGRRMDFVGGRGKGKSLPLLCWCSSRNYPCCVLSFLGWGGGEELATRTPNLPLFHSLQLKKSSNNDEYLKDLSLIKGRKSFAARLLHFIQDGRHISI